MNLINRFILILAITTFAITDTFTQSIQEKIDDYILSYTATNDFNGSVKVIKADQVLFDQSYGYANYSFQIPNGPDTKYMIGSISKQFTAAGILRLQEMGKLNIEDPIGRFFPEIPKADSITILQLLNHTSGVDDIFNLPGFETLSSQKINLKTFTDLLLKRPLVFKPGSQYTYSNGGYAILAQIIEQVAQVEYGDFLKEQIFEPLRMDNSGNCPNYEIVQDLAQGYDPLGFDQVVKTPWIDRELLKGSGSLYSTTSDLEKWVKSLRDMALLKPSSYEQFFKNYGRNYGLGISIYQSFGKDVFGHDGRINGFIADYLHYKNDNVSVIVLGNIQTGVADFFRRDIAAILFDKEYQSRAKKVEPADSYPSNVNEVLGAYSFGPNFTVYIEMIDNILMAKANEGGYSELVSLKDGRFFSRTLYSFIDFGRNEQEEVDELIWINNEGSRFTGSKK